MVLLQDPELANLVYSLPEYLVLCPYLIPGLVVVVVKVKVSSKIFIVFCVMDITYSIYPFVEYSCKGPVSLFLPGKALSA